VSLPKFRAALDTFQTRPQPSPVAPVGSGYRPSRWCAHPACRAVVPAEAAQCPQCGRKAVTA
jgi:hypothetical protein